MQAITQEGRRARVVGFGNQKGGAGKTTNTVHIGCALAERGWKVLIIDLDMNHSATRHFGVEPQAFLGAFEMLLGENPNELVLSREEKIEGVNLPQNVYLIPSARKLEGIDKAISETSKFMTPQEALKRPIESLRPHYDFIFLDTAPNATLPTIAAYMVSDYFVLTAIPDPFAIAGLNDALQDIGDARARGNEKLKLLGVLLCAHDGRTTLANSLSTFVENSFKVGADAESIKFTTSISRSTVIPRTQNRGTTLFETHPTHKVTQEYRNLAREFEERIVRSEAQGPIATTLQKGVANG